MFVYYVYTEYLFCILDIYVQIIQKMFYVKLNEIDMRNILEILDSNQGLSFGILYFGMGLVDLYLTFGELIL